MVIIGTISVQKRKDIAILRELPVKLDILLLKDRFSAYKNPVKKVFDLVEAELIYPIRRGHYLNVSSDEYKTAQPEVLANALYYPSYVSLEWALQAYGLISERVHTITSVTTRRALELKIPSGIFSYEHLNKNHYAFSYEARGIGRQSYLIATPEKALVDTINLRTGAAKWSSKHDIEVFLREDLRFDIDHFLTLVSREKLIELVAIYHRNAKQARILRWFIRKIEERVQ